MIAIKEEKNKSSILCIEKFSKIVGVNEDNNLTISFNDNSHIIYKIYENTSTMGYIILQKKEEYNYHICKILLYNEEFSLVNFGKILSIIEKKLSDAIFISIIIKPNNVDYVRKLEELDFKLKEKNLNLVYTKKIVKSAVTGLKPSSGGLHLGHYVGNIMPLLKFQHIHDCNFIFADLQLINSTSNKFRMEDIFLMVKQMIALGVDFKRVKIFLESEIKKDKLDDFIYLSDLCSVNRIERLPLFKFYKKENKSIKTSLFVYPILQTMDVYLTKSTIVFSNYDNKACVELIEEILRKIDSNWDVKLVTGVVPLLEGTDGDKMSKSKNNCICFDEPLDSVIKKIMKMRSDYTRVDLSSPGNANKSIVFKYLRVFLNDDEYRDIVFKYESGLISDLDTKKELITIITKFYNNFNLAYSQVSDDEVINILKMYKIMH